MKYSQDQITTAFEAGALYVFCNEAVSDDFDTYCTKGTLYEVYGILDNENRFLIQTDHEDMEMQIKQDDEDFELMIVDVQNC